MYHCAFIWVWNINLREKGVVRCYREPAMNGLTSLQTHIVQIRLLEHSHTKLCLHNFDLKLCFVLYSAIDGSAPL